MHPDLRPGRQVTRVTHDVLRTLQLAKAKKIMDALLRNSALLLWALR